jgi:hypothetical protein
MLFCMRLWENSYVTYIKKTYLSLSFIVLKQVVEIQLPFYVYRYNKAEI